MKDQISPGITRRRSLTRGLVCGLVISVLLWSVALWAVRALI